MYDLLYHLKLHGWIGIIPKITNRLILMIHSTTSGAVKDLITVGGYTLSTACRTLNRFYYILDPLGFRNLKALKL